MWNSVIFDSPVNSASDLPSDDQVKTVRIVENIPPELQELHFAMRCDTCYYIKTETGWKPYLPSRKPQLPDWLKWHIEKGYASLENLSVETKLDIVWGNAESL